MRVARAARPPRDEFPTDPILRVPRAVGGRTKAISIERSGGPDVLQIRDLPTPEPGPDEVLVEVEAAGINFIDVYRRTGVYPMAFPFVPGSEGAGTVSAVGANVRDVGIGERVAFADAPGAYAEYVAVRAERVVAIPDGIDTRDAAAAMLQGMTAHYLCNSTFPLKSGDVALAHAAAGGVGLLLVQLAKAAGADLTIDYTREDFADVARAFTRGRGVDVVYDSVGKTTWARSLDALRPRGYFSQIGSKDSDPPTTVPYLDGCPISDETPNGNATPLLTGPSQIAAGASTSVQVIDAPVFFDLTPSTSPYTGRLSFADHLMYRPGGKNSIWVSVGTFSWGFGGTATYFATPSPDGRSARPQSTRRPCRQRPQSRPGVLLPLQMVGAPDCRAARSRHDCNYHSNRQRVTSNRTSSFSSISNGSSGSADEIFDRCGFNRTR